MADNTYKTVVNADKAKAPAVAGSKAVVSNAGEAANRVATPEQPEPAEQPPADQAPNAAPEAASHGVAVRPTVSELKEKIMATANTDFTQPINDTFGEFQARARDAYQQGTTALNEATEFAKGNLEALVESSKVLAGGAQDLGKAYAEEAKSAYETLTADLREMAAVKSPTELFQLQSRIARRNFDALVATTSKNTEAAMKLAADAFAPITGRIDAAGEKLGKAA